MYFEFFLGGIKPKVMVIQLWYHNEEHNPQKNENILDKR